MADERLRLIKRKNAAFSKLWKADRELHKRSVRDPIPASWKRRRAELVAEYSEALSAWLGYVGAKGA